MLLLPRPVPQPLWGVNLRSELGQARWLNEVSRPIREHQRVCEVCGKDGNVERPVSWRLCCDEVWHYGVTSTRPRAKLVDLQAICWWCNAVIHLGHSMATLPPEHANRVVAYAASLNGVSPPAMVAACNREMARVNLLGTLPDWSITWVGWETLRDRKTGVLNKVDPVVRARRRRPGIITGSEE